MVERAMISRSAMLRLLPLPLVPLLPLLIAGLSGCFASSSAPSAFDPGDPGSAGAEPAMMMTAEGRWELARPGEPLLVLDVRGDVVVIERETATGVVSEELARDADATSTDRFVAARSTDEAVTAEVAGTSCVEVVAVEPEALVVRIGVMTDGRCVLSEETLRFARQTQR